MMVTKADEWIRNAVNASGLRPGEGSAGFSSGVVPDVKASRFLPPSMTQRQLYDLGDEICKRSAVARGGLMYAPSHYGYYVGLGLMQYRVTRAQFLGVRESLPKSERQAFDVAVTLHIGRVLTPNG